MNAVEDGKVGIAMTLVVVRLNRRLASSGQMVRNLSRRRSTPRWVLLDTAAGRVLCDGIDLEEMARERGALAAWESII